MGFYHIRFPLSRSSDATPGAADEAERGASPRCQNPIAAAHAHDRGTAATDSDVTHSKYRQAQTHTDRRLDGRCRDRVPDPHDRRPGRTNRPGGRLENQPPRVSADSAVFQQELSGLFLSCFFFLKYASPAAYLSKHLSLRLPPQFSGLDHESRGWADNSRSEGKHGRCGEAPAGGSWS